MDGTVSAVNKRRVAALISSLSAALNAATELAGESDLNSTDRDALKNMAENMGTMRVHALDIQGRIL